jgi:hypothetical protein
MKYFITFVCLMIAAFYINNRIAEYKFKEAYEYFINKCEAEAGEFIYRTVDDVEGLYQMRLRDPRDYFDRMRYGDIPEDPYGHTNLEAQRPWNLFIRNPKERYQFFETKKEPIMRGYELNIEHLKFSEKPLFIGGEYWRYELTDEPYFNGRVYIYTKAAQADTLKSKYGFTWKEVRDEKDKKYGVFSGEIYVIELKTKEILAVKKGFVFLGSKHSDSCPKGKDDYFVYNFISRVLIPKRHKE